MEAFIKAIVNSRSETLEIHYQDGTIVEGFMHRTDPNYNPPLVILTPHEGDDDHQVNFPKIKKVVIKQFGKETITIE